MPGRCTRLTAAILSGATFVSLVPTLLGFTLKNWRWPPGKIVMEMRLGGADGRRLLDGSPDWDECAITGLAQWNENLGDTGVNFRAIRNATRAPASQNSVNTVAFADDVFGTPFGEQTVAVANTWVYVKDGVDEAVESDVLFNIGKNWNCYQGDHWPDVIDLQRVAIHEFWHVLGLGHPDQATPAQAVDAIMNSAMSNIDRLQLDDIKGALTPRP